VSDFIEGGGTTDRLFSRVSEAPLWLPTTNEPKRVKHRAGWRDQAVSANALQMMTFAPVRHILPGYVTEGATILAGKPKIGKSWLTLDLCIAAAADRFTLGTLKPAHGDVLYLALEDNWRRLKRRTSKIFPNAEWPQRLLLVTEWRRADEGGLCDIEEWCEGVPDPVLIVIDTLEKFRPAQTGRAQAYSADYEAVTGLQKIASKHRVAIVINHHVRKMEADDPFDTVSGTLGLTGAADTILVLKRQAGSVTMYARGRDIEEMETALQFERSSCRWTILGAAADVCISNERAAVLNALRAEGSDGLSVSEIMAATGSKSRTAIDTLLFKMRTSGEITRIKRGVYALPQHVGKIGKKERNGNQPPEKTPETCNLTNLTDLTAHEAPLVAATDKSTSHGV